MNGYGWFPGLMSGGDGESGEFGKTSDGIKYFSVRTEMNTIKPSRLKVVMARSKSATPIQPMFNSFNFFK